MCMECQSSFCKKCTEEMKNEIINNHKCENPNYLNNKNAIDLLGKLNYQCKNCKMDIKKKDIENHLKEGCIKNKNPVKLMNAIYRKASLKKLNSEEIKKLSGKKVNHISGKIIFIINLFYSNIIGKRKCWKIILNRNVINIIINFINL